MRDLERLRAWLDVKVVDIVVVDDVGHTWAVMCSIEVALRNLLVGLLRLLLLLPLHLVWRRGHKWRLPDLSRSIGQVWVIYLSCELLRWSMLSLKQELAGCHLLRLMHRLNIGCA